MSVVRPARPSWAPLLLAVAAGFVQADDSSSAPVRLDALEVVDHEETEVDVAAAQAERARKQTASFGPLGERRLLDTPYSMNVVPRDLIEDQQVKSVKDIIRYIPSVQGDGARPQTRGLQGSVVQNSRIDGLNVVSTTEYPAEQFDNIQVMNGLAGSLYGPANPAGTFNYVSKRPTGFTRNRVTMGAGTGLSWLKAADLSGPLDDGGRIRYRLNLLDDQEQTFVSDGKIRRQLGSLALDFQLGERSVIEVTGSRYNYLSRGLPGKFALASGVSLPHALDPTKKNLGQSYAGDDNETSTVDVHFKHDFDGNWKLDLGALRQIADRESTAVTNTLINGKGDYRTTVSTATASRFTINSYLANLNGRVQTGFLSHDLTFGLSGFSWKNYNPVDGGTQTVGSGNLADPAEFAEPNYPDFTDRYRSAATTQSSLIFGDTLTFSPQWSLMVTGSWSRMTSASYSKTAGRTSDSVDKGWSSAGSLMYKPIDDMTLYLTYADSMQQGDTAPTGSSNVGTVLSPFRSRQWEIGGKLALGGIRLSLAAFQIKRPFAYTQEDGVFAVAGEQRNRGVDFMVDGHLATNLRMFGGVSWLDPKLLDTASAATEDQRIVGLPRITANLLTEYSLPQLPGFTVNLNARHVGRRPTDNTNDNWVGAYSTFDAGARYTTKMWARSTVYRLEVTNLTDRHYWTNIVPGGLNGYSGAGNASADLGRPRMFQASVQVDL